MTGFKSYNYKDLGITSARIPSAHLLFEIDAVAGEYVCVVGNIVYSTDDNWETNTTRATRTNNIDSGFYDTGSGIIYFVDRKAGADWNIYAWKLTLATWTEANLGGSVNTFFKTPVDIAIRDSNLELYCIHNEETYLVYRWNGAAWIQVETHTITGDPAVNPGYVTIIGTTSYFYAHSNSVPFEYVSMFSYNGTIIVQLASISDYSSPAQNQRALAYDGTNIIYIVLNQDLDGNDYLIAYSISGNSYTILGKFDVSLMLDRNVHGTVPPFTLEKGFDVGADKIYQIPTNYTGRLNLISVFNFSGNVAAMTDHLVMDVNGAIYKYIDQFTEGNIMRFEASYYKEGYSSAKIQLRRDMVNIDKELFIQVIGIFSADGSTDPDKVVFEGKVQNYDDSKIQTVEIVNQGVEMDEVSPQGEKEGRTDEILTIILDVDTENKPEYITKGAFSVGTEMGTVWYEGDKKYSKITRHFLDIDKFTFYLYPQGVMNYDNGTIDTGVDIEYEKGVDTDSIWNVNTDRPPLGTNRVVVLGAIVAGVQIKGEWNDEDDQQLVGIKPFTYNDASINTKALADAKAQAIGERETGAVTTSRFSFFKPAVGVIQVGQQITFKYISEDVAVSGGQYTVDIFIIDFVSEESDIECSSGLVAHYGQTYQELPQENSQLIQQNRESIGTKTGWSLSPAVTLSFTDGSRTFTITPDGDTFSYWIKGTKYTKASADTVVIDDTEGVWYIYYTEGTLTASQTPWVIRDGDKAFVAIVHWDATGNTAISIGYELHSHDMPSGTHNHLHHTYGTAYQSGLVLTEGVGGTVGQVGITAGEVHDEDIEIEITDGAGGGLFEQVLTLPAQIPVYYRSGATAWRKYTANDYPWYDNSGADRLYYNKLNGTWASVECTNPYYVAYWIYATHDKSEPIIAIMGQREDLRLADAKDNNQIVNLSFGTLPFPEMKILYRMIWKSSTVANADDLQDLKGVSNVPGGTYVPTPTPTLSQVVAVGDTLTSGQKIDSADEDLAFTFGRASVGYDGTNADQASFAHRDFMNQTDIALRQDNTGNVRINAPDTKSLYFSVNNANTMIMSATALTITPPSGSAFIMSISSSEDASIIIEGDKDNDDETKHAWAEFLQDGGARYMYIGIGKGADDNSGFIQAYDTINFYTGVLGAGVLSMSMTVDDLLAEVHLKVRNGHSVLAYSAGNDKYVQIYHNDTDAYIDVNSGSLIIRTSGDVDDWISISTVGNRMTFKAVASPLDLQSDSYIYMRMNADTGDYLRWATISNVPQMKIIGGLDFYIESDHATWTRLFLNDDLTSAQYLILAFEKINHYGKIHCSGILNIEANGDDDDYWQFTTISNRPTIFIAGGTEGYISDHWSPYTTNTYDLGGTTYTWRNVYYHGLSDQTCADFTDYTLEELIQKLTWHKREDGILHHDESGLDKNKYYPHIDFATIPDEFSYKMAPYEGERDPITKIRKIETSMKVLMPKDDGKGGIEEVELTYNVGDKIGIHFNTMVYAMKDAMVKMHHEIKSLKLQLAKA